LDDRLDDVEDILENDPDSIGDRLNQVETKA